MFKKFKKDIDTGLRSLLRDIKPALSPTPGYSLIYKGIKDFVLRDGKRIRPILFLISYQGYTKRKKFSYKKLVRSSLSTELLHDFLLVHDDVIDNAELRRGKPTLHRVFNKNLGMNVNSKLGSDISIVAGDIIFAAAIETLLSLDETAARKEEALVKFVNATSDTGIGEFIDVVNNIKDIRRITEKDVLLTYILKTAKYTFEAPLLMGAILAGANKKEQKKLSKLGILLGQAFQIHDDLLDVFSTSKKIGKPVLSDLNESKKTLLVWKTYNKLKGKDRKDLERLLGKKKKRYSDLLKFRKYIKLSGSDRYCTSRIRSLLDEAKRICSSLRMKPRFKTALTEFIREMSLKSKKI